MTKRTKAELVLFSTTFIWGSTFPIAKLGMANVSPFLFIVIRFAIGSLLFAIFFSKQIQAIRRTTLKKGLVLGSMLGIGIAMQNYGLNITTASKSAFITGMMVIFTPIAQLIIERRPPKIGNIIGIVVVTVGLFFLTSPTGAEFNRGDFVMLFTAMLFGVFIVLLDVYSKDENVIQLSFIQIVATGVVGLIFLPFENIMLEWNATLILIMLYLGFFATVITTLSQTTYQKDTTPTRAVIIFTIEPVIAAFLSYMLLDERMSIVAIAGASLIIGGILVSEFSDSFSRKYFRNYGTVIEKE